MDYIIFILYKLYITILGQQLHLTVQQVHLEPIHQMIPIY